MPYSRQITVQKKGKLRKLFAHGSLPGGASGKEPACQCRRRKMGSIPGSGRCPGGGHGNPLQYSCLENPMDRGAWWATVYRVAKSQTWLKRSSITTYTQLVRSRASLNTIPGLSGTRAFVDPLICRTLKISQKSPAAGTGHNHAASPRGLGSPSMHPACLRVQG